MARQPKFFNQFIGQRRVIGLIQKVVSGAKTRGIAAPSLLLIARPGQGKTALAKALAREYNGAKSSGRDPSSFHRIIGGRRITEAVCKVLQNLNFGDVLFVDEAHSLDVDGQECFLTALDEYKTFPISENGNLDRTRLASIAEFCLVFATSEPGKILPSLRDRLLRVEFVPYKIAELKTIAERAAELNGVAFTPQAARCLAERSQGSPRQISLHVDVMQSFFPNICRFGQEHVDNYLESYGIDRNGLSANQREYLEALRAAPQKTSSLERLKAKIGLDFIYLKRDIEPYLIDSEFVKVTTARSRRLTELGLSVLDEAREVAK